MMKRIFSTLLTIVMISALLISTLGICAYADYTATVTEGVSAKTKVCGDNWYNDYAICYFKAELCEGTLPAGLSLDYDTRCVYVTGTPKETGTFWFTVYTEEYHRSENDIGYYDSAFDTLYQNIFAVTLTVKPMPFEVTKSPSGETVTEGEDALFISSATAYSDVEWRIVTKDGSNCWRGKTEIENKFTGVKVSIYTNDAGQECLYLTNIPLSMNGYYVQTKFWNKDKSDTKFTSDHSCLITVKEMVLGTPTLTGQPQGVELEPGKTTTLAVTASSPDGNTLKYQWYKNNTNSTAGGQAISGATFSTYTPQELEGTYYYYCAVYNTKGDKTSAAVYSNVVAVKYTTPQPTAEPTPEPTPAPQTTPEPVQPVTSPKPANGPGKNGNGNEETAEKTDHTALFVVGAIVIVALVCGTVIFLKTSGANTQKRRRDEYEDDYRSSRR